MYFHGPGPDMLLHRAWAWWVRKGRRAAAEPHPVRAAWVLRYTFRYRAGCAAAWLAMTLLGVGWARSFSEPFAQEFPGERWFLTVGFLLLWLLFTATFAAALVERVTVSSEGLERRSLWGHRRLSWPLVHSFQIDSQGARLTFGQRAGPRIHVSLFLDGLPALIPYLETRLDPRIPAHVLAGWIHRLREQAPALPAKAGGRTERPEPLRRLRAP